MQWVFDFVFTDGSPDQLDNMGMDMVEDSIKVKLTQV